MATGRTVHIARDASQTLCGQRVEGPEDRNADPSGATCYYCRLAWEREQEGSRDYAAIAKYRAKDLTDKLRAALIAADCDAGAVALAKVDVHGIAHVRADLVLEALAHANLSDPP